MRIVHEIYGQSHVISGDSGPGSPVTITIHCAASPNKLRQPRDELIEIEGDIKWVRKALEEALNHVLTLEKANEEKE